jgi:hypothetical protein
LSTPGDIPPTQGNSLLIRVYYLYRTNMPKVFNVLFRSFATTSKDISLVPSKPDELDLIERISDIMNLSFPVPQSMVILWFGGQERLLPNAFYRAFGYEIPGERYPRSPTGNTIFHRTIDYIFRNIALGIIGRNSTLMDFKNSGGLLEYINILKRSLLTNETNLVNTIAQYFDGAYQAYLSLLADDLLMSKLGIVASGTDQRLLAMGQKLNVRVASNPLVYFDLATAMQQFLNTIETTNWDLAAVERLYQDPMTSFFKLLFSAWREVYGIDYLQLASGAVAGAANKLIGGIGGQPSMAIAGQYSLPGTR